MTKEQLQKLRKENNDLKTQLNEVQRQMEELNSKMASTGIESNSSQEPLSPSRIHSVSFIAAKYDEIAEFKVSASAELQCINKKLERIAEACSIMQESIESYEEYCYQFNIKIVGMPTISERENAEQTSNLCVKLFKEIGIDDISIQDIDIAHRVQPRNKSHLPSPIICKFTRRLAKKQGNGQ